MIDGLKVTLELYNLVFIESFLDIVPPNKFCLLNSITKHKSILIKHVYTKIVLSKTIFFNVEMRRYAKLNLKSHF